MAADDLSGSTDEIAPAGEPPFRHARFPANRGYLHYSEHYRYLLESLRAAGTEVEVVEELRQVTPRSFELELDGVLVFVDFSDYWPIEAGWERYAACLKYHVTEGRHDGVPGLVPIGPISFYDWPRFDELRREIRYRAESDRVLSNQRVYGGAVRRRLFVQAKLQQTFGDRVDLERTSQEAFWRKASDCLVSVCVPGARNDILDRGQVQYMALGACTLSPKIKTVLPGGVRLIPNVHYVACRSDYLDLSRRIRWCETHRERCREIGARAAELFGRTAVPLPLWTRVREGLSAAAT